MMLLVAYVFSYCCYLELAMRRAISSTTQRKFKAKTSYLQAHTELFSHRRFSFLITKQSPLTFLPIFATYTRKWQFFLAISANSKHQTPFFAPPTLHFRLILKMASCPQKGMESQKRSLPQPSRFHKYVTNIPSTTEKPFSDHLLHFLHEKVAFAHRKPTEKWRSSSKRRTPFSSDYRFEGR